MGRGKLLNILDVPTSKIKNFHSDLSIYNIMKSSDQVFLSDLYGTQYGTDSL